MPLTEYQNYQLKHCANVTGLALLVPEGNALWDLADAIDGDHGACILLSVMAVDTDLIEDIVSEIIHGLDVDAIIAEGSEELALACALGVYAW